MPPCQAVISVCLERQRGAVEVQGGVDDEMKIKLRIYLRKFMLADRSDSLPGV